MAALALEYELCINSDWLLSGDNENNMLLDRQTQKKSRIKTYTSEPSFTTNPDGTIIITIPTPPNAAIAEPTAQYNAAGVITIPLIDLPAAASVPGTLTDDNIQDTVLVPSRYLPRGARNWTLSAVQIRGDSMHPTIPDDSICILRHDPLPAPKELVNHIIAARLDDDSVTIKRLALCPHCWLLKPDNPKHHCTSISLDNTDFLIAQVIRAWIPL